MKISKSLYNVLQYISTIDDIFVYNGNGYLVVKEKVGSGFVEVKAPDNFFDEPIVIRSLSKFLRLFTFEKTKKDLNPDSIQDWSLEPVIDPVTHIMKKDMYITSPGKKIKLLQGSKAFLEKQEDRVKTRFDDIELVDSVKINITGAQYKQIITDCSLLDLDTIQIISKDEHTIKFILSKSDKGLTNGDYSIFEIECDHPHTDTTIKIMLSAFSLIEATDHQLEYGKYAKMNTVDLLKVKSFYDNNYTVNKVIIGKGE